MSELIDTNHWFNWHLFVYNSTLHKPADPCSSMHAGSLHTRCTELSLHLFILLLFLVPAGREAEACSRAPTPRTCTIPMRMRTGGPMTERGSRPQSGTHICIAYTCMCIPTWWPEPAGRRRHAIAYIRLMMPSHVHYACRPACSHMRSTIWYLIDGAKSPDVRTAGTPRAPRRRRRVAMAMGSSPYGLI